MKPEAFTLQENEEGCVTLKRNAELQMCPHASPMVSCGSHCPMFMVEWVAVEFRREEGILAQIKNVPAKVHIGCSSVVIHISNE